MIELQLRKAWKVQQFSLFLGYGLILHINLILQIKKDRSVPKEQPISCIYFSFVNENKIQHLITTFTLKHK